MCRCSTAAQAKEKTLAVLNGKRSIDLVLIFEDMQRNSEIALHHNSCYTIVVEYFFYSFEKKWLSSYVALYYLFYSIPSDPTHILEKERLY